MAVMWRKPGYGFKPSDVSQLKVWWRADVGAEADTVASGVPAVSTIRDQSINTNFGAWTSARAFLRTNPASMTGGLPTLEFTGATGSVVYTLPASCMSGVTSAQIFLALQCKEDVPAAQGRTGLMDWSTSSSFSTHYVFTDGHMYDGFGSATRFDAGLRGSDDLTLWHRLCIKADPSGYETWNNNVSRFSNATSSGSDWITTPQFGKSKKPGGTDFNFNGFLLEMIVYSRTLSDTERGMVDQYLADRISGVWTETETPHTKSYLGHAVAGGTGVRSFCAGMIG